MADKMSITRVQLDTIAAGLGKLKKKEEERFTLKCAIQRISPVITEALIKGYDYADIATILLRDHKIEIKPDTLRAYHRSASSSDGGATKANDVNDKAGVPTTSASETTRPAAASPAIPIGSTSNGKFLQDPDLCAGS